MNFAFGGWVSTEWDYNSVFIAFSYQGTEVTDELAGLSYAPCFVKKLSEASTSTMSRSPPLSSWRSFGLEE